MCWWEEVQSRAGRRAVTEVRVRDESARLQCPCLNLDSTVEKKRIVPVMNNFTSDSSSL